MKKLSKASYWVLSLTWGLLMTLLGLATAAVLLCCGKKPYPNMYGYYFVAGKNWGGFNMGPISVVSENPSRHTLNHEFGHSIQNCYLGPLLPFLVAIPSALRYWYREYLIRYKGKSYSELPPYDSIWFEGSATQLGNEYWKEMKTEA